MDSKHSAVYKAHVKTASLARTLAVDWRFLRILPAFRNEVSRDARQQTAIAARRLRACKGRFPAPSAFGIVTGLPVCIQ